MSAFTRIHSLSKTGVNALIDALWRYPPSALYSLVYRSLHSGDATT